MKLQNTKNNSYKNSTRKIRFTSKEGGGREGGGRRRRELTSQAQP